MTFLQSHKTSEARFRPGGRKAGAIAALNPLTLPAQTAFPVLTLSNRPKKLVPTFRT